MKLLQLASALAVAALAAATPLSNRDTAVVAHREKPWDNPQCQPCVVFERECIENNCKGGDNDCIPNCYFDMCSSGPEICRNPNEQCAHDLLCVVDNDAAPEDHTKASTADISSRNTGFVFEADAYYKAIFTHNKEAPSRRNQDQELAKTADCSQCDDWMKNCKRTQCPRPWAPECQWSCQAKLCKDGPSECHKGGTCGVHARCGAKSNDLTSPGSATAPQARNDGDGWDKQECDDYLAGCINAFCHNPLHNGPNCEKVCHNTLCETHAGCCKAQHLIPSTGALDEPNQGPASPTTFLTFRALSSSAMDHEARQN